MRNKKFNEPAEFPIKTSNSQVDKQQQGEKSLQHVQIDRKFRRTRTKLQLHNFLQEQEGEVSGSQIVKKTRIPQKRQRKIERKLTMKKNLTDFKSVISDVNQKLRHKSSQYVPEYFAETLQYMIEKEDKSEWFSERKINFWRQLMKNRYFEEKKANMNMNGIYRRLLFLKIQKQDLIPQYEEIKEVNWAELYDNFALVINEILSILLQAKYSNSVFPCCYFFYMFVISDPYALLALKKDNFMQEKLYEHLITSLLAATKYHEIYPFALEDIIESIYSLARVKKILRHEHLLYKMNSFSQFYSDNQSTFMKMFAVILNWKEIHLQNCLYVLESGLNNPLLYEERPSYKASAVCVMYEKMKFKSIEKSGIIRELTGIPVEKQMVIIRKYMKSLNYNKTNRIFTQKRKYFVFGDFFD